MNLQNLKIKSFRDNKIAGKTLFTMNLALWFASAQNKRVLYISLADQTEVDFITRCESIISGCTFAEAYRDIRKSYEDLVRMVGSNLEISINSAGNVTAQQIVDLARERDADVVIVDYDGCIKNSENRKADDSMYNVFGDVYNKMTELSLEDRRLVIMCSQLKSTSNQGGNLITLNDLAESSKKGQVADGCICLSKISGESPNQVFNIRFTKCRRGKLASGFFARIQARFIEIPRGLAEQLCAEMEDRDYTEQQIISMAQRYKQSEQTVQQALKQQEQQRRQHDNPFS